MEAPIILQLIKGEEDDDSRRMHSPFTGDSWMIPACLTWQRRHGGIPLRVLVSPRRPRVLPPTQRFDGALVHTLHVEPRRGMMAKIMKPEVSDPKARV